MPLSVVVGTQGKGRPVTVDIDRLPDFCPLCNTHGKQEIHQGAPVWLTDPPGSIHHLLYMVLRCPRDKCARPYFAVYEEAPYGLRDNTYYFRYSTPHTPSKYERNETIERISESFYDILDQSAAAESYRLTLIAGAGYRKALEYLVKDYAVRDLRAQWDAAVAKGDADASGPLRQEITRIVDLPLGQIIDKYIPEDKVKNIAKRAAWLGNDETHYTRKWEQEDIETLKFALELLINHIVSTAKYDRLLTRMPDPN